MSPAPPPHTAPEVQRKVYRAERRFLWVVATVQTIVIAVMAVALLGVLVQEERNAHDHRVRNEDIHACIIAKEDAFRRDVYRLLQTQPGTQPTFPEADGITCPAIRP